MPCVCRFYGITIYLYAGDHHPPHFHARYAGQDAAVGIRTSEVIVGRVSERAMALVREWAAKHQAELLDAWNLVQAGQLPAEIEPLA